jgi:acyl-coenzyme A synthetase/AMP-(fatty) acid ligase
MLYLNIINLITEKELTICMFIPTILNYISTYYQEINLPTLRYSFFGGEPLYYSKLKGWQACCPNAIIENFYGPTEISMSCTNYRINKKISTETGIVPIGAIHKNQQYFVLDNNNNILIHNAEGELCIAGSQVFSGYLNINNYNTFIDINGKKYYPTGDKVKDDGGVLHFCGRLDRQIKRNGYRIELFEIESALKQILNYLTVVVVKNTNDKQTIHTIIETSPSNISIKNLKLNLAKLLPYYMIPDQFHFVDSISKNINGKINYKTAAQQI